MIKCHRSHLEARCLERGYTLEQAMPCVVTQDGDEWTIDPESPAYPRPKPPGPGSELKRLLAGWPFRITTTDSCPCNAMARQMDQWGCDGCAEREDEIVAHLREQAAARGLPFIDAAGRMLIRRAIKLARRNAVDR